MDDSAIVGGGVTTDIERELSPLRVPFAGDRKIAHNPHVRDRTPPPYDIVGDIHGCIDEFCELLDELGYLVDRETGIVRHLQERTLVFLGDLNDRGPGSIRVWKIALASVRAGTALYVPGNHDSKFARWLMGRDVRLNHGLKETVLELLDLPGGEPRHVGRQLGNLLADSPPYRILDDGRLVVAHAGIEERMIGRVDSEVASFARFGEKTGEVSDYGFPIRRDWAADYRGKALVVYGHTPTPVAEFRNNTINIDQGCAFGGMLTALRYPERETVSVRARRVYAEPAMDRR